MKKEKRKGFIQNNSIFVFQLCWWFNENDGSILWIEKKNLEKIWIVIVNRKIIIKKKKNKKFYSSNKDKIIIRNLFYDFYIEKEIATTLSKLLMTLKKKLFFWKLNILYKLFGNKKCFWVFWYTISISFISWFDYMIHYMNYVTYFLVIFSCSWNILWTILLSNFFILMIFLSLTN